LMKDEILKVVQAHLSEIDKCYTGVGLPDRLILKLIINPDGTVKKVQVLSSTSKDNNASKCIIGQVKKWRLPAPVNGREVKATVTLVSGS